MSRMKNCLILCLVGAFGPAASAYVVQAKFSEQQNLVRRIVSSEPNLSEVAAKFMGIDGSRFSEFDSRKKFCMIAQYMAYLEVDHGSYSDAQKYEASGIARQQDWCLNFLDAIAERVIFDREVDEISGYYFLMSRDIKGRLKLKSTAH